VPSDDDPVVAGPGTTLTRPEARVEHIAALRPDICTLDLNTMNSAGQVVINTPRNVRRMARIIREAGVKPEIELFDSDDIAMLHDLISDGTLDPASNSGERSDGALKYCALSELHPASAGLGVLSAIPCKDRVKAARSALVRAASISLGGAGGGHRGHVLTYTLEG
jgi:hypothetical protein